MDYNTMIFDVLCFTLVKNKENVLKKVWIFFVTVVAPKAKNVFCKVISKCIIDKTSLA